MIVNLRLEALFLGGECIRKKLHCFGRWIFKGFGPRFIKVDLKTYIGNMVYLHPVDLPNKIERFGELNCWENFRKLARNGDMFQVRLFAAKL